MIVLRTLEGALKCALRDFLREECSEVLIFVIAAALMIEDAIDTCQFQAQCNVCAKIDGYAKLVKRAPGRFDWRILLIDGLETSKALFDITEEARF